MSSPSPVAQKNPRGRVAEAWTGVKRFGSWVGGRAKNVLLRDVKVSPREFATLLFVLWGVAFGLVTIILGVWDEDPFVDREYRNLARLLASLAFTLGVLLGGLLVDSRQDKTKLALGVGLIQQVGLFLATMFNNVAAASLVGISMASFCTTAMLVVLGSYLVHFTSLLDRGRVNAYLFIVGGFGVILIYAFVNFVTYQLSWVASAALFVFYVYLVRGHSWYEKNATPATRGFTLSFWREMFSRGLFLYVIAQFLFTFICGVSFGLIVGDANFFIFILVMFVWSVFIGLLLDNIGRKVTMVVNVLLLSFVLTLNGSSIDFPVDLLSGIFSAVLICALIIAIVTSGDLGSSEINGRGLSLMYFAFIAGLLGGVLLQTEALGELSPEELRLLNDVSSLFLVVLMALLIPLRETLRARDLDFREKLLDLFVIFEENGILLYHHRFHEKEGASLDPDLASGGITGGTQLFREITKSDKKIKILDQEDTKILFEYGEFVVCALISTEGFFLIRQRLRQFLEDFEHLFRREIGKMRGDVEAFDATKYLVDKHFY
ncbi:MAG: MFS transporter [Promethearchaeota archaeon]